jgi:TetR/AcrR family transcriptional regulator, transcriptional repressor for nem operon
MTRRQPPAARRQAILDAAASLLVAHGLAGTSVDAVAQHAGIAKGTVYLYFASRSDLLAALRSRYAQGLADRAASILGHADPADPGSVIGAFERLAAELLGYVHANQRLYHVLFYEAPGYREQAAEPLAHLVAGLLRQAMDQGTLTSTDPGVLARFLLDGLHGALLPLAHQDQPRVPASLSQILRRLLAPARTTVSTKQPNTPQAAHTVTQPVPGRTPRTG